jgi:hypothetical protein
MRKKNSRQDCEASKRQNRKQFSAVAAQNPDERFNQQSKGSHWNQRQLHFWGRSAIPSVVQAS